MAGSHLASGSLAPPGKRARTSAAYGGAAEAPAALSAPPIDAAGAPRFHNLDVGLLPPEVYATEEAETAVSRASSGGGQALPEELSARFSASLGADLGAVRIHTDSQSASAARAVGAKAYAIGQDIHFAAGQYDPMSAAGQHLLAHEVAHTVQQAGGAEVRQNKLEVSAPDDAHEVEADRAADAMVTGQPTTITASTEGKVSRFWDEMLHELAEFYGYGVEEGGISGAADTVSRTAFVENDFEVQSARGGVHSAEQQVLRVQQRVNEAVVKLEKAEQDLAAGIPSFEEAQQAYEQARGERYQMDNDLANAEVEYQKAEAHLQRAIAKAEERFRAQQHQAGASERDAQAIDDAI